VFTKTMRISSKIITVLLIEYKKIAQILAWKRAEILYSIVEI